VVVVDFGLIFHLIAWLLLVRLARRVVRLGAVPSLAVPESTDFHQKVALI
jgi:hypothetical protein